MPVYLTDRECEWLRWTLIEASLMAGAQWAEKDYKMYAALMKRL